MRKRKPYLKLLYFALGFLALSVLLASFFRMGSASRKTPSLGTQERNTKRNLASSELSDSISSRRDEIPFAFFSSPISKGPAQDRIDAEKASGVRTARARVVRINALAFQPEAFQRNSIVHFNFFNDLYFRVQFYKPSALGVNYYRFQGTIHGDSDSLVDLIVDGANMTGTIDYKGRKYRIINFSGDEHFVLEEVYL